MHLLACVSVVIGSTSGVPERKSGRELYKEFVYYLWPYQYL
jgi:hypothetical protein